MYGGEPAKSASPAPAVPDPRHISNGWNIPSEGYADQPYIVKTDDGAWLCVMTTGVGAEGAGGQHVVSMRSTDQGRTWDKIVPIEPADGPEASYAVLLKVPSGRIYAFYNHNTDRVPEVKREDKGVYKRVDSLGHYVFKYSDDHGGKDARAGFSLDLWLQLDSLAAGQSILDSRDETGAGILVSTAESGTIAIALHDGRQQASWDSDRGVIQAGKLHHVVITVDGGPKIITFVVGGVLCDGGDQRQFGWGRFSPTLRTPNGSATLKIAGPCGRCASTPPAAHQRGSRQLPRRVGWSVTIGSSEENEREEIRIPSAAVLSLRGVSAALFSPPSRCRSTSRR